jgi:2-C-methyl-D-erythritol 2,4-cyclodiphosphate synthase
MKFRVGTGYDVHQLKAGLPFTLGGIVIPHDKGALGHSDADTLIHAIMDAMLGAAAMGDIGSHFPDTSMEYKGIDSKLLLARTNALISAAGYKIGNIDSIVILQKPKIKEYIPAMRSAIAQVLGVEIEDVSIKATTTEKLGFTGREEGVAAQAVVLLEKIS